MKTNDAWVPSNHPTIVTIFMIIISIFDEMKNNDDHDYVDGNQPASWYFHCDENPTVSTPSPRGPNHSALILTLLTPHKDKYDRVAKMMIFIILTNNSDCSLSDWKTVIEIDVAVGRWWLKNWKKKIVTKEAPLPWVEWLTDCKKKWWRGRLIVSTTLTGPVSVIQPQPTKPSYAEIRKQGEIPLLFEKEIQFVCLSNGN